MIIDISKLNKTKGGTDFSYNDRAEDAIANAVCYYYDLQSNGGTVGFDPTYDKLINSTKVEIKISSSKGFYLEIAKGNDDPSGIFTSEADIYMTVNPGQDKGSDVIKVRVYNKMLLQRWAEHKLENHPDKLITYKPSSLGPGSQGFMLDFKAVDDLYIIGFDYERNDKNHIVFDTHAVFEPSQYARNNIRNFIK